MGEPSLPPPRISSLPSNPRPTLNPSSSSPAVFPDSPGSFSTSLTNTSPRRSLPIPPEEARTSGQTFGPPSSASASNVDEQFGIDDIEESKGEGLPAYLEEPDVNETVVVEPTGGIDRVSTQLPVPTPRQGILPNQPSSPPPQNDGDNGAQEDGQPKVGGVTRFGRWREWVEKRAVERIDNDSDRAARRNARHQLPPVPQPPSYTDTLPPNSSRTPHTSATLLIHPIRYLPAGATPTLLPNTSLLRLDYGPLSQPHSNYPINTSFSIPNSELVLLGTTNGLKVLNTSIKDESNTRNIWSGLPVWEIHHLTSFSSSSMDTSMGGGRGRAAKGYIVLLVGGIEDPITKNSVSSRPKKNSGTEIRIYRLSSIISLAKYSSIQSESYMGLDLSISSALREKEKMQGKGKGKSKDIEWIMIDRSSSITSIRSSPNTNITPNLGREELVTAWSKDYTTLPSGKGHQGDNILVTTYTSEPRIFVAIGTSNHVIIHGAFPSPNNRGGDHEEEEEEEIRFTASRTFYLPSQPSHISFLQLPPSSSTSPSYTNPISTEGNMSDDTSSLFSYDDRSSIYTGNSGDTILPPPFSSSDNHSSSTSSTTSNVPSLGLYISFGSKACLIRVDDSTVLDLKLSRSTHTSNNHSPLAGFGIGEGSKGDWGALETLKLKGGGEIYVLTRGKETFLFSAPFSIPSHSNTPLHTILWPESPSSLSATVEYTSSIQTSSQSNPGEDVNIKLISTSFTGNLHIQHLNFYSSSSSSDTTPRVLNRGKIRCKPFISIPLGNLAKIIQTEHFDLDTHQEQQDGYPSEPGSGCNQNGCWIRYRRRDNDWRVVKFERE